MIDRMSLDNILEGVSPLNDDSLNWCDPAPEILVFTVSKFMDSWFPDEFPIDLNGRRTPDPKY
jgi:hypothetical protein